MRFGRRDLAVPGQTAVARRFLQFGTGCVDEIKDRFKMSLRSAKGMAGNHDPRAAMTFAPVIEGKLDLGSLLEKPFCQKADPLGAPMNLVLDEIDGVGKTDGNWRFPVSPDFAWGRHRHLTYSLSFI
jgi:hypothetical protein